MDDPIFVPAYELAMAIRRREVSSSEIVDAHLAHVERHNPRLNAVVTVDQIGARASAWTTIAAARATPTRRLRRRLRSEGKRVRAWRIRFRGGSTGISGGWRRVGVVRPSSPSATYWLVGGLRREKVWTTQNVLHLGRRDGPGRLEQRSGGGGKGHRAARARVLMAAPRGGLQG
jgi:hypothetical protein